MSFEQTKGKLILHHLCSSFNFRPFLNLKLLPPSTPTITFFITVILTFYLLHMIIIILNSCASGKSGIGHWLQHVANHVYNWYRTHICLQIRKSDTCYLKQLHHVLLLIMKVNDFFNQVLIVIPIKKI